MARFYRLPPEKPAGGPRVGVPVIGNVPHVLIHPVLADLLVRHVLEMREHVQEMLGGRVHAVLPPDHHRALADLTPGDPADLVLVEPAGDAAGATHHAVE